MHCTGARPTRCLTASQWYRSGVHECKQVSSETAYVNAVLGDLKSLQEVGSMWATHYLQQPEAYHAVVFLRADVFYPNQFPVEVLPKIQVLFPLFVQHQCCQHGFCCVSEVFLGRSLSVYSLALGWCFDDFPAGSMVELCAQNVKSCLKIAMFTERHNPATCE